MSIQFENPMNEAARKMLEEMFAEKIAAMDDRQALINSMEFEGSQLKALTNVAGQPVALNLHDPDEIKTMSDGTQYRVTPQGWRKITNTLAAVEGEDELRNLASN